MPRTHVQVYLHLIFATKKRFPYLQPPLQKRLFSVLGGLVRRQGGVALAIGGMPDQVHLLVRLGSQCRVSDLLKAIKGSSSRWLNGLPSSEFGEKFAWQEGYAAYSVSPSQVPVVQRYIERQEEHHAVRSYEEEMQVLYSLANGCPGGTEDSSE